MKCKSENDEQREGVYLKNLGLIVRGRVLIRAPEHHRDIGLERIAEHIADLRREVMVRDIIIAKI